MLEANYPSENCASVKISKSTKLGDILKQLIQLNDRIDSQAHRLGSMRARLAGESAVKGVGESGKSPQRAGTIGEIQDKLDEATQGIEKIENILLVVEDYI